MKFFIVAAFLFLGVQALTPEEKVKVDGYFGECAESTGAEEANLLKIKSGNFDFEDEKAKNFVLCMFKKVGIMSNEGELLREQTISKVEPSLRAEVTRIYDLCIKEGGATLAEKVWNYSRCYEKERPGKEDFF